MKIFRENIVALTLFFIIASVLTYPLVFNMKDRIFATPYLDLSGNYQYQGYKPAWVENDNYITADPDCILGAWIIHQLSYNMVHRSHQLFKGTIFYPWENTLTSGDPRIGDMFFSFPVFLITSNPVFMYNFLVIFYFMFSAFSMYLFLRYFFREPRISFIGGLIFGFLPYHFAHLEHAIFKITWLPLIILYLHIFLHTGRLKYFLLSLVFCFFQIFISWNVTLFVLLSLGLYVITFLLLNRSGLQKKIVAGIGFYFLMIFIFILPLLIPYLRHASVYRGDIHDPASLIDYFLAAPNNRVYFPLIYPLLKASAIFGKGEVIKYLTEHSLFPGLLVAFLCIWGMRGVKKSSNNQGVQKEILLYLLLLFFVSIMLSFGPRVCLGFKQTICVPNIVNYFMYRYVFLSGFRIPARFYILLSFPLSFFSCLGLKILIDRISARRYKNAAFLLVGSIICVESLSVPLRMEKIGPVPPVYDEIKDLEAGVSLLELPTGGRYLFYGKDGSDSQLVGLGTAYIDAKYMFYSTYHHKRIFNGYNAIPPPYYAEFLTKLEFFPSKESLDLIKSLNIDYVIVHPDLYLFKDKERMLDSLKLLQDRPDVESVRKIGKDYLVKLRYRKNEFTVRDYWLWKGFYTLKDKGFIDSLSYIVCAEELISSPGFSEKINMHNFKFSRVDVDENYLMPLVFEQKSLIALEEDAWLEVKVPLSPGRKTLFYIMDEASGPPRIKVRYSGQEQEPYIFVDGEVKAFFLEAADEHGTAIVRLIPPENKSLYILFKMYIINISRDE